VNSPLRLTQASTPSSLAGRADWLPAIAERLVACRFQEEIQLVQTFGDAMRADRLICMAVNRRPFHYFHIPEWQAAYQRGVQRSVDITGMRPRTPKELLARRRLYEPASQPEAGT